MNNKKSVKVPSNGHNSHGNHSDGNTSDNGESTFMSNFPNNYNNNGPNETEQL